MNQQTIKTGIPLNNQNFIQSNIQLDFFECDQRRYNLTFKKASKSQSNTKKHLDWNKQEKITYGKVLLSFLMKNTEINSSFLQLICQLLGKSFKEATNFHRKMKSEYSTIPKILSHILRVKPKKLMRQIQQKQFVLQKKAEQSHFDILDNQVYLLNQSEMAYLQNILLAQDSLQNFQQNYEKYMEIFQLNDELCCEKDQETNDSFQQEGQQYKERDFNQS